MTVDEIPYTDQQVDAVMACYREAYQVHGVDSAPPDYYRGEVRELLAAMTAAGITVQIPTPATDLLDEWATWALEHLPGPAGSYLRKAEQEWAELRTDPNVEEAIDVIMCLAAYVKAMGRDPGAWVLAKHEINAARTWERQPDGTYQHVADPA